MLSFLGCAELRGGPLKGLLWLRWPSQPSPVASAAYTRFMMQIRTRGGSAHGDSPGDMMQREGLGLIMFNTSATAGHSSVARGAVCTVMAPLPSFCTANDSHTHTHARHLHDNVNGCVSGSLQLLCWLLLITGALEPDFAWTCDLHRRYPSLKIAAVQLSDERSTQSDRSADSAALSLFIISCLVR